MNTPPVPSGWRRERIGNLARVSRGASPRPIASPRWFSDESEVGWVRIADLGRSDGLTLTRTTQRLSPAGVARSKLLPPGTLIMSIAATVGLPVITGIPACIHDGFVALQNLKGVDQTFLLYVLESLGGELRAAGQTGSQSNINTQIVKDLTISLPPEPEQRRIVEVLVDINREIAILGRLIEKKKAIRRGILQQLLSGTSRLPSFQGHWRRMTVGELAVPVKDHLDPRDLPPNTLLVELDDILPEQGRLRPSFEMKDVVSMKTAFRRNDVLFGRLRSYLRKYWLADRPGICSTEIWVFRPTAAISGAYLRYLVETQRFVDGASGSYGTHMPRSDWSVLRRIEFEVPPLDEQQAVASVIGAVDSELESLSKRLSKASAVQRGMRQDLLSGRIRLPAEDVVAA